MIKNKKAFTIIELLIAAGVLVIAILTTAFCVLNLSDMNELSREKTIALADADRVLESMRDTANNSLASLRTTDWTVWAAANVINTKGANEIRLDQENAAVAFASPTDNPAQLTLTLNWSHKGRPYSYQVTTLLTDRT